MDFSHRHHINTPCVGICTLDKSEKFCFGCGRKIQEIEDWYFLSDHEKLKILSQIPARKKNLLP